MTRLLGALFCLVLVLYPKGSKQSDELRLFNDVISTLNTTIRPPFDANDSVNVTFDLVFAKLGPLNAAFGGDRTTPETTSSGLILYLNTDLKAGTINFIVWFRMYWEDRRLSWNPLNYGNLSSVVVPFVSIWHPGIILYNSANKAREAGITPAGSLGGSCTISSNGKIFFSILTSIKTFCHGSIEYFPYDDQQCHLTMGTWSRDKRQIDLFLKPKKNGDGIDMGYYENNTEWELLGITAEKHVTSHKSGEHVHLQYTVRLRRMPLYYVVNYTVPTIIVSLLGLLVFLIPPEVGKRMEAGINLLLCLAVYLLLVNSKVPTISTSFPMLTKFYGCTIIILVVAMCCSCCVYSLYFMNPSGWEIYHMHPKLKIFLFDWLGPLLQFPKSENVDESIKMPNRTQSKQISEQTFLSDGVKEDQSLEQNTTVCEENEICKGGDPLQNNIERYELRQTWGSQSFEQHDSKTDRHNDISDNAKESSKSCKSCEKSKTRRRTKSAKEAENQKMPSEDLRNKITSSPGTSNLVCPKQEIKGDSIDKIDKPLLNDRNGAWGEDVTYKEKAQEHDRRVKKGKKKNQGSAEIDKEKSKGNRVNPKETNLDKSKQNRKKKDFSNPLKNSLRKRDTAFNEESTCSSSDNPQKNNLSEKEKPKLKSIINPCLEDNINNRKNILEKSRDKNVKNTEERCRNEKESGDAASSVEQNKMELQETKDTLVAGTRGKKTFNENFDISGGQSTSSGDVDKTINSEQHKERNKQLFLVEHLCLASETEMKKEKNIQEWKKAAKILNRLFLILMFISIIVSFSASFLASPRVREKFKP